MSDKPYYDESQSAMLRTWILGQMLRGMGYGAALVIGVGLCLGVLYGISLLLPEESKQAPSPMGSLTVITRTVV
jgi:hypothetical protein